MTKENDIKKRIKILYYLRDAKAEERYRHFIGEKELNALKAESIKLLREAVDYIGLKSDIPDICKKFGFFKRCETFSALNYTPKFELPKDLQKIYFPEIYYSRHSKIVRLNDICLYDQYISKELKERISRNVEKHSNINKSIFEKIKAFEKKLPTIEEFKELYNYEELLEKSKTVKIDQPISCSLIQDNQIIQNIVNEALS